MENENKNEVMVKKTNNGIITYVKEHPVKCALIAGGVALTATAIVVFGPKLVKSTKAIDITAKAIENADVVAEVVEAAAAI